MITSDKPTSQYRSASSLGRAEGRLISNCFSEHWSIAMTTIQSSGIEPGQRRLNGPQTTGRNYRNLSHPEYGMTRDDDVAVLRRDGVALLADVHRPTEPGRYPVLVAASPYPRQIQNLGAPAGFIEAGASDFFVPRGYVHVIANCRGTGGSGGK